MPRDVLQELKDAAEADDRERVTQLIEPLTEAFDRSRKRGQALDVVAKGVTASDESGEQRAVADSVAETTRRVNMAEMEVNRRLRQYLDGGDPEPVVAAIDDALATHEQLDDESAALDDAKQSVEVPPVLVLTTDRTVEVPKGETVDTAVTLENLGTATAETVELEIDAEPSLSLGRTAVTDLSPDESATVDVSGPADEDGTYKATVTASTKDADERQSFQLAIRDKRDYLVGSLNRLKNLYVELTEAENPKFDGRQSNGAGNGKGNGRGKNGNGKGNGRMGKSGKGGKQGSPDNRGAQAGMENKIETTTKKVARTIEALDNDEPATALNGRIDATTNQLGALRNHVDAQAGKHLTTADATLLREDVRLVIEELEDARNAAV